MDYYKKLYDYTIKQLCKERQQHENKEAQHKSETTGIATQEALNQIIEKELK